MANPCKISCTISAIFIISMIYFFNATSRTESAKEFESTLTPELKQVYNDVVDERKTIYFTGYVLGFIFAFIFILYNVYFNNQKLSNIPIVCISTSIAFITNFFYYILSPKKKWLLENMTKPEQTKAWLKYYKSQQYHYYFGFALGIFAVAIFAFAFRCGK